MRATTHRVHCTNDSIAKPSKHVAIIDVLGGGDALNTVFYNIRNAATATILTDVHSELQKHQPDVEQIPSHILFPLSERETTTSLLDQHYGASNSVHEIIGSALSVEGMGARGGIGAMAGMERIQSRDFDELVTTLLDKVIQATGGDLEHVWLRFFGSGAGGTNSLLMGLLARALGNRLKSYKATIKISFFVTDSIAYTGLGQNIHKNHAYCLFVLQELLTNKSHDDSNKIVYELRVIGMPPTGTAVELRQELKLLDRQSWFCSEMQRYLQVTGPNKALESRFGNIVHTSTDFFRPIPREIIASGVSSEYYFEILQTLNSIASERDMISQIEPNHETVTLERTSVPSIVASAGSLSATEMLDAITRPGAVHRFEFAVIDRLGQEFVCDRIADHFVEPPRTLKEAHRNATIVETIRAAIDDENLILADDIQWLEGQIDKKSVHCKKRFERLARTRYLKGHLERNAITLGNSLRQLCDELGEKQAMQEELVKSLRSLELELAAQEKRLRQIAQCLDIYRSKGKASNLQGLFYFRGCNEAFSDLLSIPGLDDDRRILLLAAQASSVSIEGLRFILDAENNNAEELALKAIGDAHIQGAWPGAIRQLTAKTIYVLPPTSKALAGILRARIRELSPNSQVFVADSCDCGINVVRFRVYHPKSEAECHPGFLKDELDRVLQGPHKLLHQMPPQRQQT